MSKFERLSDIKSETLRKLNAQRSERDASQTTAPKSNASNANSSGSEPATAYAPTARLSDGTTIFLDRLTRWAKSSLAAGDRCICFGCAGTGAHGRCQLCLGRGAVCPTCRGWRSIHLRTAHYAGWDSSWDTEKGDQSDLVRCPSCCEGNNVSEVKEVKAIKAYIELGQKKKAVHDPSH